MTELFEPIAVVGRAVRLPGAAGTGEYWRMLRDGRDGITALTEDDLRAAGESRERTADPAYVRAAGLIAGIDQFDPGYFAMSPREAQICDPQIRLMLETAHQAIEDAGYGTDTVGRDVAVFAASGPSRYATVNLPGDPRYAAGLDFGTTVLNNIDYLATLVSYKFDFRGPSMSVLTACSSALAAVHLASQSLQLGECDVAVAGAANVELPYGRGYRWSPGDVRSADGRCRPFDALGGGTVFTSGAGAVVLKRLGDAIVDGDTIRGVIRGIGISNDGSDKVSFSAPSVTGQVRAIADAMTVAGLRPQDIDFVEMHATGTALGDPVEMAALSTAYAGLNRSGAQLGPIPVGSVKGNVGHTVAAAGLAGLVKLLLALEHEELPPTAGLGTVNPRLELEKSPFTVATEVLPWRRAAGRVRRAAMSSLGVGGTNVHLVVEEGPPPAPTPARGRARIVVWSGHDTAAADAYRQLLADRFESVGDELFADTVATLQQGRRTFAARQAMVCHGAGEAAGRLRLGTGLVTGTAAPQPVPVTLFFPGAEAAYPGMAAGLYGRQAVFTEEIDVCFEVFAQHGTDLYARWQDPGPIDPAVVFAVQFAMARQLRDLGVEAGAVCGAGVGALTAAVVGGRLGLDTAVRRVLAGDLPEPGPVAGGAAVVVGPPAPGCDAVLPSAADRGEGDEPAFLTAVARLWTEGRPVRWDRLYRDEPVQHVPVPGYPWRRQRCWVDLPAATEGPMTTAGPVAGAGAGPDGPYALPVWTLSEAPEGDPLVLAPGASCLALVPLGDQGAAVAGMLRAAGLTVTVARPGSAYRPVTADGCVLRPDNLADDLGAVLARLRATGDSPSLVVHAWAHAGDPPDPATGVYALTELVRRAVREPVAGRLPALLVLTRGGADVSGGEPVRPAAAALTGLVRSFALESPGQWCRMVDLGGRVRPSVIVDELRHGGREPVVAWRGSRRWVPAQRPFEPVPAARPPIRAGGVYVITGGLGGLGRAVARELAGSGAAPGIALLGRRVPADAAEFCADLASAGARARVIPCDVADPVALAAALDEVAVALGPVAGVFHLAGVAGRRLLQVAGDDEVRQVLRPKVAGTVALRDCLRERAPVDFVVCFSSRAALTGMVGGAHYAAANAFMDAVAVSTPGWRTVNWPAWTEVGMAAGGAIDDVARRMRERGEGAPGTVDGAAGRVPVRGEDVPGTDGGEVVSEVTLAAETCWALDDHRLGGTPVLPGTALVDLILRACRERPQAGPVMLRDVVFSRPVTGAGPHRIRVVMRPDGDGWWVRVLSRGDAGREPWREHVTCVAAPASAPDGPTAVAGLRRGLSPVTVPASIGFGPRWQSVAGRWESAEVTLLELRLPEPYAAETGDHAVHPALFDTATGFLGGGPGGDGFFAPFAYGSLTWYDQLPPHVFSRLRVRARSETTLTVDVHVVDAVSGAPVAVVEGLRMRRVDVGAFVGEPGGTPVSGLPPATGVGLLLRLMADSVPDQVAVRWPVSGAEGPGEVAGRPESRAEAPEPPAAGPAPEAGEESMMKTLLQIWIDVLGRTDVQPDSDFFDLDGDSLGAVALTGQLRDAFGVELGVGAVFDHPTPRELGELIARELGN